MLSMLAMTPERHGDAVDCHVNLMTVYRAATEPKTWAPSYGCDHMDNVVPLSSQPKPTGKLSLDNESWISPASLLKTKDLKLALQGVWEKTRL